MISQSQMHDEVRELPGEITNLMPKSRGNTGGPLAAATELYLTCYRGWSEMMFTGLSAMRQVYDNVSPLPVSEIVQEAAEMGETVAGALERPAELSRRESEISRRESDIFDREHRVAEKEQEISLQEGNTIQIRRIDPDAVQVDETDKDIIVSAEFPGFEADQVEAQVRGKRLTIKGEKHERTGDDQFHVSYRRELPLPRRLPAGKSTTSYHDGIIEVHIPKTERKSNASKTNPTRRSESGERGSKSTRGRSSGKSESSKPRASGRRPSKVGKGK
jgi:HSP20 family molecular chaperone IbpA